MGQLEISLLLYQAAHKIKAQVLMILVTTKKQLEDL
jgi:hypothetical protein